MNSGTKHSDRVRQALARLPEIDPAIGVLAIWCQFRDVAKATHTHGDVIHIGPEFPLLPISQQTGLLAHHVMHVALRHSERRTEANDRYGTGFHPNLFDLACDGIVNEALLQSGHALPRPAVRASEMIALLPPSDRPESVLTDWDCDRLYQVLAATSHGADGGQGSAAERYAKVKEFQPDLEDSDPQRAESEKWAGRVEQALAAGRNAGVGIGMLLNRFGDLPRSTIPWEIRLRRMLNKTMLHAVRQNYARPARAWLARDAMARQSGAVQPGFEPGQRRDTTRPRLVIAMDTSSSVPDAILDLFAAEAIGAARRSGAKAHLLGFDTEVHSRTTLDDPAVIRKLALRRGGGTDYAPVISEARTLDPSIILMLTDLDAPIPDDPGVPVLWVVPQPPRVTPPFGTFLTVNNARTTV